ncbi:carbon-nitrogen hydrolase family protein [Sinobacterium caligoides]|nr:carbon-nitrogen hydrolase family protein [Sinobacterium caligoides]
MQDFKIAVAQTTSKKGDVAYNLQEHVRAIKCAMDNAASVVVFPELSLTGYEPQLAQQLALTKEDARLKPLQEMAIEGNIYVVAGAPIVTGGKPEIGAIIFSPDGDISSYSKIHLHPGEDLFFQAGSDFKILDIKGYKIAMAICADTNNEEHVKHYAEHGVSIYVAGVLIGGSGYASDTDKLASYASKYHMLVTVANHNAPTGVWEPVGRSAAWDHKGPLAEVGVEANALLVSAQVNGAWTSEAINIE